MVTTKNAEKREAGKANNRNNTLRRGGNSRPGFSESVYEQKCTVLTLSIGTVGLCKQCRPRSDAAKRGV